MQLNFAFILALLAGAASTSPASTPSTNEVRTTPIPSTSPSTASQKPPAQSPDPVLVEADSYPDHRHHYYDCMIGNRGCNWMTTEHRYGRDSCGYSPYDAIEILRNGDVILAVAQNGRYDDCVDQTSIACCRALAEWPCARGEAYLQCFARL